MAKQFTIDMNGSWTLPLDHIWPDGDAPKNPKAEDVARLIKEVCGSSDELISEWNLRPQVTVDGVYVELL